MRNASKQHITKMARWSQQPDHLEESRRVTRKPLGIRKRSKFFLRIPCLGSAVRSWHSGRTCNLVVAWLSQSCRTELFSSVIILRL
jgi:hypothetical protein